MIYIKNNTEIQTIFIPRTELQKEAYIASTKTYEDGYKDGYGEGKQYQKDQLLNLYVTENGQYEREDGWGVVTVDMSIPDCSGAYDEGYNQGYEDGQNSVECPEGGTCNLGEGEIYLTTNDAGFYELYAADDGYDGWSKFYVTLENSGAIKIHKAEELIQMFNEGWGIDFGAYYYVGGQITEIQEVNTQYGNATYTLDNGFKVYRGDWIDGNHFGSEDQIKVGAYIAVYGIIQDYNGQLQFKAHSQVIAYQECEGGDLNIDAVSTSLGAGNWSSWTRTAPQFGLDGMSEITIDGSQYQEWTKAHTLLQAYQHTEEAYITENGEYRPNIGYDGFALNGYNVAWVIDVVPTIDTDVEIWVKPYDGAPNMWQGFIGSQVSDDDNTTFQIRRMDGNNVFSFRFGEQIYDYWFEYERWYRLRMNRYGVWVNGEQVCGWDVQAFEENPNPLMINGIYNLNFEEENYRMNYASYGYVYFHNTDSLLVPFNNDLFIGNKNQTIEKLAADGAVLQYEIDYYSKGYTKVVVDIQNGEGGNCDDAYNSGYSDGYNDGQANCNPCNLTHLTVTQNGWYDASYLSQEESVLESMNGYGEVLGWFDLGQKIEYGDSVEIIFSFSPNESEIPTLIGCESDDWGHSTFAVRQYGGNLSVKIGDENTDIQVTDDGYEFYHKLLIKTREGIWFDDEQISAFDAYGDIWTPTDATFCVGAMNSLTDGFWRPWNGCVGNVTIYKSDGSEHHYTVGDYGRWGEYRYEEGGTNLPNLKGDRNAYLRSKRKPSEYNGFSSVEVKLPTLEEQITDYIYNQITLYSYRKFGFNDFEECFYDSNNEPITDVLVVTEKVDFEYSFKLFTKVPIKTCSKIPYPNNPLYGLTRLYFKSIPSVNLNYKDNNVLSLYIEDVDYLNMDGATLNGLLRIWLKGTTTFSQGLEIGTAQIKDSGTVYSDGTNTDKISSSFSTWTIINDHKLP